MPQAIGAVISYAFPALTAATVTALSVGGAIIGRRSLGASK